MGYSLALNHPFIDGNKRVAHAALETFLVLNGRELEAGVDDAERRYWPSQLERSPVSSSSRG